MTAVRQALLAARQELAEAGVTSPDAVAATLIAHVLGVPPGQIILSPNLTPAQNQALTRGITAVADGQPVQYVTGQAWFRTVSVAVGPGVFIPRPETEVLAGWAIDQVQTGSRRVVELCAGSGAITLAIVTEAQPSAIWAVEIDPVAMTYLRRNLAATPAQSVQADMVDALPELNGTIDLVVANPPYIPLTEQASLPREVLAEPARALFADGDGLAAIHVVAKTAWRLLRPGGLIGCEHGDGQADTVVNFFVAGGWSEIESHDDLTGRPRFVTARRPAVG